MTSGVGREIKAWAPAVRPWGDLRLYEVGPIPAVRMLRIDSSVDVESSHAAAAFDNALASGRNLQRYWFAGEVSPGWIEAEFERSVPVSEVAMVTQSVGSRQRAALRLEGKRGKNWVALETQPEQGRELADGWWIRRLTLAEILDLQGIRLVFAGAGGGIAPQVAEITLLYEQKPYIWLRPD